MPHNFLAPADLLIMATSCHCDKLSGDKSQSPLFGDQRSAMRHRALAEPRSDVVEVLVGEAI